MTKKKTKSQTKKQNDDWFGVDKLKPPGRPAKDIDFNVLDKLLALHVTRDEAAAWFNVSHDTLERRIFDRTGLSFASYREQKSGMGRINLRRKQYQVALSGNVAMLIWLGKQWLGQSEKVALEPTTPQNVTIDTEAKSVMTFEQFCVNAGYPAPYPKQIEMKVFGIESEGARLILGSRGYGKTDYVVILGVAYRIYTNPLNTRVLIITKSRERNSAILGEIATACEKAGVVFEINNSNSIRVQGLLGKDHTVSAATIKSVTLRGRHPDLVIMDDPVTPEDTSEATRNQVKKVYNEVNKLTDNVLIIGQPVHKYDLYQHLRPKLSKMEVPHGTIPELDHDLEAQRLAGVDEASIQASYFLNILSEGALPFENIKYVDKFPKGEAAVAFIDPAFGGQDYTALTVMKAWMDGVAVIGWIWRKSWEHCLEDMAKHFQTYNVKRCAFETNKTGDQPLDILRKALKVGCVGVFSNTNKHSRIMAAGTYAHMIHLSNQSHPEYIKQVIEYEHGSKHDDAPDSLASCLAWIGLIRGKQ